MVKNIIYFLLMLGIVGCNNKVNETAAVAEVSAQEHLLNAFPAVKMAEGPLHFYNIKEDIVEPLATSIVKDALSESLLDEIGFQTGDTTYETIMRFSLDENHTACVLNANEFWYKQQSLLIFNNSRKTFEKVVNLSQFYGGDGGQIVTESWLYSEASETYLYGKESSHAIIMKETTDEPEEFLSENSKLYKWNGNVFESAEMPDSIALSKKFELSWKW